MLDETGAVLTAGVHRRGERVPLLASTLALGAGLVWSFGAITIRLADHSDAFQYLIWRSVGIVVVIEAIACLCGRPPVTPRAFRTDGMMLLACVCLLIASLAFVYAVKTTTPANAAFLASMTPLVAVLLTRVTLGEPLTATTMGAVGLAFIGLLVTVVSDLGAGGLAGNVAALMSSVGFAGYAICLRTDQRRDWSPVMPGYAVMMIAICVVITLIKGEALAPPAADIVYAMVHGGVFIVVGTMAFNIASRRVPAVAMTVFAQSEMLFIPIWALIVLSARPRAMTVVGGAIIASAVVGKALLDAHAHRGLTSGPAPAEAR